MQGIAVAILTTSCALLLLHIGIMFNIINVLLQEQIVLMHHVQLDRTGQPWTMAVRAQIAPLENTKRVLELKTVHGAMLAHTVIRMDVVVVQ